MHDQQTTSYPCLGTIDVHGGYQVEGNLGTYSHEQGNLDMAFHSRPSLNELSSSSYEHPQQEATLTHARFNDPSSEHWQLRRPQADDLFLYSDLIGYRTKHVRRPPPRRIRIPRFVWRPGTDRGD
jgi:hypothetical protein